VETRRKSVAKKGATSGIIQKGKMDIGFFALVTSLLTIGLLMLFSSSYAYALAYFGDSYHFIKKQALFAIVGFVLMMLISKINYHIYRRFAWVIYIISAIMLLALLILPPMVDGMDVKRWIVIGPVNFQPSEVAKFAIILLLSSLIAANQKQMKSFGFILFLVGLLGVTCVLVVLEPHLSATVLIFAIGVVLMIVGGLQLRYIIGGGLSAVGLFVLAITVVGYSSDRITYWLNPWAAPTNEGYQTIQSLLAIGSGGILGRGIGQSRQKYLWVPEPHNDFIFSVVCEETGFIGAALIMVLFAMLIIRGFWIAVHSRDRYSALVAAGITGLLAIQVILNIAVVTNLLPCTGISLPFFSYGGTALLIQLAEIGVVLSISRDIPAVPEAAAPGTREDLSGEMENGRVE